MGTCSICGSKIYANHPSLYNHEKRVWVCMRCEGVELEVFKLSVPGGGPYLIERSLEGAMEMFKEMDVGSSYLIEKIPMRAEIFLSLPEFEGF